MSDHQCISVVKGNLRGTPYSWGSPDTAPLVSCGKPGLGTLPQVAQVSGKPRTASHGCI